MKSFFFFLFLFFDQVGKSYTDEDLKSVNESTGDWGSPVCWVQFCVDAQTSHKRETYPQPPAGPTNGHKLVASPVNRLWAFDVQAKFSELESAE